VARILIWSPNYAPELTGIPPLVTDAAEWLAAQRHSVEVVTAVPNYPARRIDPEYRGVVWRSEHHGDVVVHRSWLRVRPEETFRDKALYELTFATLSLPQVIRRLGTADALVCVIPSLVAAAYASLLMRALHAARRRPRFILWMQDLVFSAAASVDGLGAGARRLLTTAGFAEKLATQAADCVVVCSPGFRIYLAGRGLDEQRILTIYNWVDVEEVQDAPTPTKGRVRFLYSGNLGYTQGFGTLLEATRLAGPNVEVEIVGEGNAATDVRRIAEGLENVTVRAPVPRSRFPELLTSAHVDLVLQRRISAGANFPSKIASYLASGRPILASIAPDTSAAQVLRASAAAVLVPPEDPPSLAAAMNRLQADDRLRERLGKSGREYAVRMLDRRRILPRLEAAILG
jgi:glycosyltransferase involved in cell wall biosynthesis